MSKEMREQINKVKNFGQFLNENTDNQLRLKDIISIPQELKDIFDICKNEIDLSNSDLSILQLYSKIYFDCLMQHYNLTSGGVDIILDVRNYIIKSSNEKEVKLQYNKITKPTHILPADLLKMLTDYKEINFVDEKLQKYRIVDIMISLVKSLFTNTTHYSVSFKKKLLNSKIKVGGNF